MRYYTGGLSDFAEAILKGAVKGTTDYVNKDEDKKKEEKEKKKADEKKSAVEKAVDYVADSVSAAKKKQTDKAVYTYVIVGLILYYAVFKKGRR